MSQRKRGLRMEPVLYTVKRIDGDYAVLVDEKGDENRVAMALLPMEIDEESKVLCEYFAYTLVEWIQRNLFRKGSAGEEPTWLFSRFLERLLQKTQRASMPSVFFFVFLLSQLFDASSSMKR